MLTLIAKEFRIILKDWHAVLALFLLPVIFILIMAYALKDASSSNIEIKCSYFINQYNDKELSQKFEEQIKELNIFTCKKSQNSSLSRENDIFLNILADFFDDFASNENFLQHVEVYYKPSLNTAVISLFEASLKQKIAFTYLDKDDEFLPLFAVNLQKEFVRHIPFGDKIPNSVEQSVPSWTVFAMFFILIPASTILITERQQGTLNRLRSLRLSPFAFFASKAIVYNVINVLQGILMVFVGVYVVTFFGLEPLRISSFCATFIMIFALSTSAIGFAFLVATISKSSGQAVIIGGLSTVLIGSFSGIMVPKFVMPEAMQTLSNISPMSWGLDGFLEIFLYNGDVLSILKYAIFLMFFGFVLFFISLYILLSKKED